jgi:hypothetical protein
MLLGIFGLFSEEISSKVNVSSESVGINEPFQLDVEISNADRLEFQGVDNLDPSVSLNQIGLSSQTAIVNGKMSSSQIITFYVVISKEGKYSLGPFKFKVKDKIYRTNAASVNVIALNSEKKITNEQVKDENGDNQKNFESQDNKNSNYIIRMEVNKKEAYINEPIDITIKFYIRTEIRMIKFNALKLPANSWAENILNDNDRYAGFVDINNVRYQENIVEKKRFYVTRDSVYNISPVEYQFVGYKGNDFFAEPAEMTVKSNPVSLNIKPLPPNPPAGFDGAVGSFKFNSSLNTTSCKVKEPVDLQINLEGNGNFQNIKDASYVLDDNFEVYSSKNNVSGDSAKKTWDIIAVPSRAGKLKIKVNDFVYFDLAKKEYVRLKGREYTVNVRSDSNRKTEESVIINKSDVVKKNDTDDIGYLKTVTGNSSVFMNYDVWFRIIAVIYVIFAASLIFFVTTKFLVFNRFVHGDEIKMKNSFKDFYRKMNDLEAKRIFNGSTLNSIYAIAENFFKTKFKLDSIDLTANGIQESLRLHLDNEEIAELKDIFLKIDMQRFGGMDLNETEISDLVTRLSNLVKRIENRDKS